MNCGICVEFKKQECELRCEKALFHTSCYLGYIRAKNRCPGCLGLQFDAVAACPNGNAGLVKISQYIRSKSYSARKRKYIHQDDHLPVQQKANKLSTDEDTILQSSTISKPTKVTSITGQKIEKINCILRVLGRSYGDIKIVPLLADWPDEEEKLIITNKLIECTLNYTDPIVRKQNIEYELCCIQDNMTKSNLSTNLTKNDLK